DAAHGLAKLPHDLRLLGIAEVEAVGDAERLTTAAHPVAGGLDHGGHAPDIRIELAVAAVAVDAERQRLAGAFDAHDRRVGAGPDHRIAPPHPTRLGKTRA